MYGSVGRGIASLGVGVATILVLLGVGVAVFFNPPFVAFEQDRANVVAWTGFTSDQVHGATDAILMQLYVGPGDFAVTVAGQPVLNPREQAHMRDVRGVFAGFGLAVLVGAVILVVARWRSGGGPWLWRAIRTGSSVLIAAVVILGLVAAAAFDQLFEVFHTIFFAGGTFDFDPRTDRLVQLFPDQFWYETSIALAGVLVILAVVVRVLAGRRVGRTAATAPVSAVTPGTAEAAG